MSILADILDDNCTSLDDWTVTVVDGTVTVDDGFKLDITGGGMGPMANVIRSISSFPNETTCQIITNFPALGPYASSDPDCAYFWITDDSLAFLCIFSSDGLLISDEGTPTLVTGVKCNATAEDQIWRFEINKTTTFVTIYLNGVSLGVFESVISLPSSGNGIGFGLGGRLLPGQEAHLKSFKIGTGLGEFIDDPKVRYWVGNTGYWTDTAHWSLTSGGTGGAPVPTANNDVYFDSNSFTEAGQNIEFE